MEMTNDETDLTDKKHTEKNEIINVLSNHLPFVSFVFFCTSSKCVSPFTLPSASFGVFGSLWVKILRQHTTRTHGWQWVGHENPFVHHAGSKQHTQNSGQKSHVNSVFNI